MTEKEMAAFIDKGWSNETNYKDEDVVWIVDFKPIKVIAKTPGEAKEKLKSLPGQLPDISDITLETWQEEV